jgi:excisionase family DNA binding protein
MPDSKTFDDLPTILTPEEAADLLRLDVTTLKAWARAGRLPGAFKLGRKGVWRVRRDELVAYILAQGKDGKP